MDKFDRYLMRMNVLGAQEVKDQMTEHKDFCVCPECPTYDEFMKENAELLLF